MTFPLRAGDVVVDKYRIERQLGSGGMGIVLEATHLQLNQPVALKFLVDSGLEPEVAAERFLREARATFRLRSEHTVRVMDVGTLPTGHPFIVMELLVGKDFKQLLAERGPLPAAEAGLYMRQVCSALSEAHALGIVHRDLKARNLYLTKRVDGSPCVKVLDFGISKLQTELDVAPLTQPDTGMGSPRYMAPEQWVSASTVDARADIYAAGAVFYELLTGNIPLAGLPLAEVIKRVRAGAVPSPREQRPDLPESICRVVMRALRPHPEERFPTAQHFAQAILDALPEIDTSARPKPVLATTIATAVVNRQALLARAQVPAIRTGPSSSVPTPKERPDPPSTDPDMAPVVSSTLDEGVPVAAPPMTLPVAPQARAEPSADDDPYNEDLATVVQKSPLDQPPQHATLQVAEAPPELQALRNKYVPQPMPPRAPMATPQMPVPIAPPPPPPPPFVVPPAFAPAPTAESEAAPASRRLPGWLFWLMLVVIFCFVGGAAAAVLTRFLR